MASDLIYREDAKDYARHAMAKGLNVLEYLDEAPAADFRPVVRARWNTVKHPLYECSNCSAVYQDVGYGFNFCPNCGARMDGGDDV